jgi:hypothetical protein
MFQAVVVVGVSTHISTFPVMMRWVVKMVVPVVAQVANKRQ